MAQGGKDVPMCIECDDVPATVRCAQCEDQFCGLCFQWLHRKGKRALHSPESLYEKGKSAPLNVEGTTEHFVRSYPPSGVKSNNPKPSAQATVGDLPPGSPVSPDALLELIKCIPLRLSAEERKLLSLLESALEISEYTDKVDVSRTMSGWGFGFWRSSFGGGGGMSDKKDAVIQRELNEVFSLISGLYTATDFKQGKALVQHDFKANETFFQRVFEVGRRFKIMNPDKMRNTYGKLMHLLQDAVNPTNTNVDVLIPIQTVYLLLKNKQALDSLHQHWREFALAAAVVTDAQSDLHQRKCEALAQLKKALVVDAAVLTEDELELCINSINDHSSYVTANCYPIEQMLRYLHQYFREGVEGRCLEIRSGQGGSYLTHNHATQFRFVKQSLMLWNEIQRQMCELWILTDADLLDASNRYRLCNTGQGMNRVQAAPRISTKMRQILHSVQSALNHSWIGLSVVHLGDRDVPNGLVFIDKYTQVPRILGPIARTIDYLETLVKEDERIRTLVEKQFDGLETSKIVVLRDYFRHGFDGSGDDGGSCIDGRLTSSWNWTSKLEKKYFYSLFKLADFDGFDGDFRANN